MMVTITKTVNFKVYCRADCGKRIRQEMVDMGVHVYSTRYVDMGAYAAKIIGKEPDKEYELIEAVYGCDCDEKAFDELVKHFEADKEYIHIII